VVRGAVHAERAGAQSAHNDLAAAKLAAGDDAKLMTDRLLAHRFDVVMVALAAGASVLIAAALTMPAAASVKLLLAICASGAVLLALPPNIFLPLSFLFFAMLQIFADTAFSMGGANIFISDLFVGLVALRALAPNPRASVPARHGGLTVVAFLAWSIMMVFAGLRGAMNGAQLDVVVRYGMAVLYWPILYLGFSRIIQERTADRAQIFRAIVAIAVGLTAYMFLMRALDRPFEPSIWQGGSLGRVPASSGEVFHRDYGFYSAYIVYPLLALIGVGQLIYAQTRRNLWLGIALIGIAATATTLMRTKTYGLLAGLAILFLVSRHTRVKPGLTWITSRRLSTFLTIVAAVAVGTAALAMFNSGFAHVVGERSIPYFVEQSEGAEKNAEWRQEAFQAGTRIAGTNINGVGILAPDQMLARNIEPGYFVDSGFPRLLVFLGWPGLVAAVLVLLGLILDSKRLARTAPAEPWLHPVLVGLLIVLIADSFGNASMFGDAYVIGVSSLIIAFRFTLASR
jgi:hypothetical protein